MTTRNILFSTAIIAAITVSMFSCRKDKDNIKNTDKEDYTSYAMDNARLEQTFNDVQNISDQAASPAGLSTFKTTGGAQLLSGCATVTHDTISVPHVLTVDFGATNCLCNDGRYRRGQIIVTHTGAYKDSGHVHTISFNNYFVNDNQVFGTKTVTNMGTNAAGNYYYTIAVNGGIVRANTNDTLTMVSNRVRTWTNGYATPFRGDDAFEITGSGTITKPNGATFNVATTAALQTSVNCNWIKAGIVTLTPPNNVTRTLDYGNGNCDDQATLTVNGNTTTITLP